MNVLEKLCKQIAQKINLAENLHIAAIFENSESDDIIGWAVLDENNNILKQYDEIDELFNDYPSVDEMYEKHRTDTFRVVCEIFCCDPKEVLRRMIEHRNEVMPKIIEAEKKSIAEANAKATDKLFHTDDIIIDRTLGTGYPHLLKVEGYDSVGRWWVCFDSDGTYYALTQDEINKYEYATEQETVDFKELQDKSEKDNEKKTTDYNKFYYIENTVDECHTEITAYCKTLNEAKERLKTCRDWYGEMGTGRIYEVKFGGDPIGKLVYEKE